MVDVIQGGGFTSEFQEGSVNWELFCLPFLVLPTPCALVFPFLNP